MVKDCKKQLTSLGVAWVDYRKAHNMDPAQLDKEVHGDVSSSS